MVAVDKVPAATPDTVTKPVSLTITVALSVAAPAHEYDPE